VPVARKVATSGSYPGYRQRGRCAAGALWRRRGLPDARSAMTQAARVEDTPECRVGFPILRNRPGRGLPGGDGSIPTMRGSEREKMLADASAWMA